MKIFIEVFPMIFQNSMGLKNQGVTIHNDTTQGKLLPNINNASQLPKLEKHHIV